MFIIARSVQHRSWDNKPTFRNIFTIFRFVVFFVKKQGSYRVVGILSLAQCSNIHTVTIKKLLLYEGKFLQLKRKEKKFIYLFKKLIFKVYSVFHQGQFRIFSSSLKFNHNQFNHSIPLHWKHMIVQTTADLAENLNTVHGVGMRCIKAG